MIRTIGALCLFLSCSGAGFAAAAVFQSNRTLLHAFSETLALLRSEIGFGARSLPEIFSDAAESAPEPLCGLFCSIATAITAEPGGALSAHVSMAVVNCRGMLPRAIREGLIYLGSVLGGPDADGQIRALELCEERIRIAERSSEERLQTQCRACRTIGLCVGGVAAILVL